MNVSAVSVYAWEKGSRSIPSEVMHELETRYNISTSWLHNGTEPMMLTRAADAQALQHAADVASSARSLATSGEMVLDSVRSVLQQFKGDAAMEQLQAVRDYLERAGTVLSSLSREVFSLNTGTKHQTRFPLMSSSVSAGSPVSTSDETVSVDIVEFLVNNPEHTFFVNVVGDSMKDIGIYDGDTLIIDRSIVPKSGEIIVARVFNELTVKRFVRNGKRVLLAAENKAHKNIEVTEDMDFSIIGVVTTSIKKFRS